MLFCGSVIGSFTETYLACVCEPISDIQCCVHTVTLTCALILKFYFLHTICRNWDTFRSTIDRLQEVAKHLYRMYKNIVGLLRKALKFAPKISADVMI